MKKKIVWIVVILLAMGFLMTHRLEPELRVYPLAMGFDATATGYQVYYDLPELSVYTGEGKTMEESERVWSFEGFGSEDIERQVARTKKQTPDMGHVQAIILGSNLLADPVKYAEVLESFVQEPMLGSSSYVFFSNNLQEVMSVSAATTDSLGEYLVDLIDKSQDKQPIILQDLYNAYYNEESLPLLMEVLVENGTIAVNGLDRL